MAGICVVGLSLALIRLPPFLMAGTSLADAIGNLLLDFFHFFLGGVSTSLSLAPSCTISARTSSLLSSFVSSKGLSVMAQTFGPFPLTLRGQASLLPVSLPVLVRHLLFDWSFLVVPFAHIAALEHTIFLDCFSWHTQNPSLRSLSCESAMVFPSEAADGTSH